MRLLFSVTVLLFLLSSCSSTKKLSNTTHSNPSDFKSFIHIKEQVDPITIYTKDISPDKLVDFAETLKGVKYQLGGCDKVKGFDCSGFVWYVFNHFDIKVPRTAVNYTNAGKEIKPIHSKRGDIILFTGIDPTAGVVGHMGLITKRDEKGIQFIHAASGGGKGVMVSNMSEYFYKRFVKIIRVFE